MMNLPNSITLGRIALVPVILLLYSAIGWTSGTGSEVLRYTALFFFLIASFSDLFDGYFARRRGQVSTFGKVMDPVADKLLALSLMIVFSVQGLIPVWYTLVFLWRELAITTLRAVALEDGVAISASNLGKRKTLYLNIGLGFLFSPPKLWIIPSHLIAWVSLAVALVYCLASAWQYVAVFYRQRVGK